MSVARKPTDGTIYAFSNANLRCGGIIVERRLLKAIHDCQTDDGGESTCLLSSVKRPPSDFVALLIESNHRAWCLFLDLCKREMLPTDMIISFDIGEKNFAYSMGAIGADGTVNLVKFRLHDVKRTKTQTILESCDAISRILESDANFVGCQIVLIEQQMRANVRAQRIAQHVWTWFRVSRPAIVLHFVPSHLKTQFFLGKEGAAALRPKQRKIWAASKVRELLTERGDTANLDYMNSLSKQDDVADTFLQLLAWCQQQR